MAVFDATRHCGARSKRTGLPCAHTKGMRTDHAGSGNCWLHGGRSPAGIKHARREQRLQGELDAIASLTLAQIADRLARVAAAETFASDDPAPTSLAALAAAFAKFAERAEGSKLTLEGKLEVLAAIPDTELDAAIAEIERMIASRQ